MVTTYNEKDLLSFAEFVKRGIELDGLENANINNQFKQWLYATDKARFTVGDLVSFGNHMMERVASGEQKQEPDGTFAVCDANIGNWIHDGKALVNESILEY